MLSREAPDLWRAARPPARALRRLAALGFVSVALAGCGEGDGTTTSAGSGSPATELVITVSADGRPGDPAEAAVATVSCPGAESGACDAIAALPDDPGAPVPPETACTEIYGGPDVVTIEGTIEGEPIDAELTRVNGCEIERFDRFAPLLEVLFPDYEPGSALRG